MKLKPGSALNEQTYGLQFEQYIPYYYMGVCYLKLGENKPALEMFKKEEERGAIRKSSQLYKDLTRARSEATDAENARIIREVRRDFERLVRESEELSRKSSLQEALAKLALAAELAKSLEPETARRVTDLQNRIRATEDELQRATAKAQRIGELMADGQRRLDEGNHAASLVAFEGVLSLDPQNTRAQDGKRLAQEGMLASTTRQKQAEAYEKGKAFVEAGQYEAALVPLTEATADPRNVEARDLLKKAAAIVDRVRQEREKQVEIDKLVARGERLFAARQFAEAIVAFQGVLRLDKGIARVQERLTMAERRTGEALLARYLPNREPDLYLSWPDRPEIESPTLTVRGRAFDDWGIAKVELRVGGKVVAELAPPPRLDTGEPQRMVDIDRELQLEPGPNEVVVTAIDSSGLQRTEMHQVTRRLRFYETALFVPSAGAGAVGLLGTGLVVQRVRRRRAIRRRFNPYIAGAPVLEDEMFFGREKLTQRLLNVLHHNSLMITGERRIGKTTFLYHLKKVLTADEGSDYRFFPVFVDLQGVPEHGFFHALMSDVVEALGLTPATRESLRFLPQPDSYDGRDFSHDLQRVIEELKGRTEKKVKLALLIDEVDVLNEYSERINQRLRSIFMKTFSENLVAVMSGVGVKRTWNSEVSPWYNFFDEIEIAGFTREEAEALIKRPVAGVFRYQPEAVERILALSQLKPYLLQKFCVHAVNRMLEDGRTTVRSTDVEAARQAVMFEGGLGAAEPAQAPTHVSA